MKKITLFVLLAIIATFMLPKSISAQTSTKLWGMTNSGGQYGIGTIFSTDTGGTNYTVEYSFLKNNGKIPYYTHLCQATNGKLYGMTSLGGLNNCGVLFEFDTATGAYNVKLNFDGPVYGSYPYGSLVCASNGKLYGMTTQGGFYHFGVLFEYDPVLDTTITKFEFDGTLHGSNPYGSLIQAPNGKLYGMTSQGGTISRGVLFDYDIATNTVTKDIDFNTGNGSNPYGSLVAAPNGKLYGMTSGGGANGFGVIFEYNTSPSTLMVLYSFPGSKGSKPYGSLIVQNDSLLYGLTSMGGLNSKGVLFQYNKSSGVYLKKFDFDSIINGCKPYGSLALAPNGKLYGMTSGGGAYNSGILFEYDKSGTGTFTKKLDLDSTTNGRAPFGSLMRASNGILFGMTSGGGTFGKGVIFRYDAANNTFTKKLNFEDALLGCYPDGSLVQASNGKLYGMTSTGGSSNQGVIFEYDPVPGVYIIKHNFDCPTGCEPHGSLFRALNGKLYGLTCNGGANGSGVLFEFEPVAGTYTSLHDFNGLAGGGNPYGSVIQATNGKLYGMTKNGGGVSSAGVIFCYDLSTSTFSIEYTFNGLNKGKFPYGDLVEATNGKLYGMTSEGGTSNLGIIFDLNPLTHGMNVKYNFSGALQGSSPFGNLIQASNGKFYGLTSAGGTNSVGILFEWDTAYLAPIIKVNFDGAPKGSTPYGSLMQASNGKLYGMTNIGGSASKGVLFEYKTSTNTYTKKIDFQNALGTSPKYTNLIEVCSSPLITGDPADTTICSGNNAIFTVAATGNGLTYQWQVNMGGGYTNLHPNAIYTNVTDDTLHIIGADTSMDSYIYRCLVTSSCPVTSLISGKGTLFVNYVVVSFSGLAPAYCIDAPPATLTGNPAGGTFSGAGISGNIFTPANAGPGNHVISYTYNTGTCTALITQNVFINSTTLSITGLDSAYCIYAPPVTVTGTPGGGSFTGAGMSGSVFTPANAGAGSHVITYSYTDGLGCTTIKTKTVFVSSTAVSFSGLNSVYCLYSAPATLTGSPTGGTFSGAGIAGNQFSPGAAGAGGHWIKYQYTNAYGCTFKDSIHTNVNFVNVSFSGLNSHYCIYASPVTLTGNPVGGTFTGAGMLGNIFRPNFAGAGPHWIKYSYTDGNNCTFADSSLVTVDFTDVYMTGLNTFYCLASSPATITLHPTGGTLFGAGISGNVFTPSSAGAGTHLVTYTYTDGNTCTFIDSIYVTVGSTTNVTISGLNAFYCYNAPIATLTGNPTGGTFTGTGMVGNTFNPALAGTGTHTIIYTYNGGSGCIFADTVATTVGSPLTVSFTGLPDTSCLNGSSSTLTGTPLGGSYTGAGISGNVFNPLSAGSGYHTITYSVTGANNCVFSTNDIIYVDLCTGVNETGVAEQIVVLPNPNNGIFFIRIPSGENYDINIFNNIGSVVYRSHVENETEVRVDLGTMPKGIYYLEMTNDKQQKQFKLIVQ